jgi:hypothetical protein
MTPAVISQALGSVEKVEPEAPRQQRNPHRTHRQNPLSVGSVENVEPEADERRFHKEIVLLAINNRKTRFWVVARLQLRAVEHCSIEISFCAWLRMTPAVISQASRILPLLSLAPPPPVGPADAARPDNSRGRLRLGYMSSDLGQVRWPTWSP